MTAEEELKVRAQGESQALVSLQNLLMSNYITQAGEIAVLKAKLKELEQKD